MMELCAVDGRLLDPRKSPPDLARTGVLGVELA